MLEALTACALTRPAPGQQLLDVPVSDRAHRQRTVRVMDGTGSPGAASDEPEARRQKPAGAWAGYLIFALCLMVLIVLDARAAYDHS